MIDNDPHKDLYDVDDNELVSCERSRQFTHFAYSLGENTVITLGDWYRILVRKIAGAACVSLCVFSHLSLKC